MKVDVAKPLTAAAIAPLRILLLEHSATDAEKILRELQNAGFAVEPTVVSSRQDFLAAVASSDFSVVLSAYQLPEWDGMQAFEELRRSGKNVPFILVTGVLGEEAAAECVRRGVSEYVLKSHLARLPIALRRALEGTHRSPSEPEPSDGASDGPVGDGQLMIENAVYGLFRVSLDGTFLSANQVLLQILACPSLSVLQSMRFSNDVFRFPEHYAKLTASCRQNGLVHSVETEWRRRDGGFVAVKLHLRYLHFSAAADQLEGIVEDVTELRALEHQLRQIQKFEAIGDLASGVAHDFNNVIGAILGWAELGLEESRAYPQIADRFARIRGQADRAAELTRELLAIGRRQTLMPQTVDLNSIISNLAIFLEKVIGSDIDLQLVPGDLRPVHADPSQIEHVLINLCLNARDAMPKGGRLQISTEVVNVDATYRRFHPDVILGPHAVISVSDTGTGISPQIRDRIFEPFFTTKARGNGTGMGLATAYGIVRQHGGFIHVYSEPGQGSLFRVYLPAIALPRQTSAPELAELPLVVKTERAETILFAEDHDSIREMTRQSLVRFGYRVLSAANGEEALQLCNLETPALAILDLVMPRMGGAAAAAQLRDRLPNLPILFTSGYSENQDSAVSGFPNSSYLQKPYSPTTLGRAVRKILDRDLAV
jgi:two-component system, cell cycle sensor histidine kinase and response regulator CckA